MSKLQARNEIVVSAHISKVWALLTDINQVHKTNPGVVSATGSMNQLNGTRTCVMNNNGRTGTMTERLIEFVPEKKTVWTIENDSMGMKKMIHDSRFCFYLEKVSERETRVINESYYQPANLISSIMNILMMKRMMSKLQAKILSNIKRLVE